MLPLFPVKSPWLSNLLNRPADAATTSLVYLVVIGALAACAAILWGAHRVFSHVFPRSVFLLGQRKGTYRITELWQWSAIIGFFVSLAAGIVLAMVLAVAK
jgi:hypothetical protein